MPTPPPSPWDSMGLSQALSSPLSLACIHLLHLHGMYTQQSLSGHALVWCYSTATVAERCASVAKHMPRGEAPTLSWTSHGAQRRAGPVQTGEPNTDCIIIPCPRLPFWPAWSLSFPFPCPFHDPPDVLRRAPPCLPPCQRRRQRADLLGHLPSFQCPGSVRARSGRDQPVWDRFKPDFELPECLQ